MFKYTIPQILQWLFPSITWKVKTLDKVVFLTFDDGPHPEITPWVMDCLASFNAKATFFCVGENVVKYLETVDEIVIQGHSLGNHTFNHLNGWKTADIQYFKNIEQCEEKLHSDLFRPPYGRITLPQWLYLKKKYRIVMWNILSRDYDVNLNTDTAFRNMTRHVKNGSIVVFHDSIKAEKNLKVLLPKLLSFLHENGYEMKRL